MFIERLSSKNLKKLTIIPEISEVSKETSRYDSLMFPTKAVRSDIEPKPQKLYLRPFGKFSRKLIFSLLFFINIVINMDHGAIPAGIKKLQEELDLGEVQIGLLGSFVFFGLTLGMYY